MSLYVSNDYERCPSGVFLARCYRILDIGTQKSSFQGVDKLLRQVVFSWEVHAQNDEGRPLFTKDNRLFSIQEYYTLSWSEKSNLRKALQSWRGRPFSSEEMQKFDLKNVLGAWCMLNIIDKQRDNGGVISKVGSISPVPPMIRQNGLPEKRNKDQLFSLDDPDMEIFESLSDSLKEKIRNSPEWKRKQGVSPAVASQAADSFDSSDDEIPF